MDLNIDDYLEAAKEFTGSVNNAKHAFSEQKNFLNHTKRKHYTKHIYLHKTALNWIKMTIQMKMDLLFQG